MEDNSNLLPEAPDPSGKALSQPRTRELLARNWVKAQPSLMAYKAKMISWIESTLTPSSVARTPQTAPRTPLP